MPQDEEQANERTKLLYHAANDRRLSAVQQEEESQSLIGSHLSKDELALHNSPVGERLPYNDYTTIDWLHDLVRQPLSPVEPQLTIHRSNPPTVTVLSILNNASAMLLSPLSKTAPAGSLLPS